MGYTTDFYGEVNVTPPLNADEISFLQDLCKTRRMNRRNGPLFVKGTGPYGQGHDKDIIDFNMPHPDQPGLWCHWKPTDDGEFIEWDGGEKFYYSAEWMKYIVENLLSEKARPYIQAHIGEDKRLQSFTCNHVVDGQINAEGEDSDDRWILVVENSVVKTAEAVVSYGDAKAI